MIVSFAHKPTAALWRGSKPPELPPAIHQTALRKLTQLSIATTLDDLRVPPGNRLEPPVRDRAGQHSIRINDQYRICFRWVGSNAHQVEIVDYHS